MSPFVSTLIIAAALAATAGLCGWLGARPLDLSRRGEPRLVPWRGLMLLLVVAVIVALVHALNLAGVATGDRR